MSAKKAPKAGQRHKIVQHGLEKHVLKLRGSGKTLPEIRDELNERIRAKGNADRLTTRAIERYLATLDEGSVPIAHQPQVAEENVRLGMNVAGDVADLTDKLRAWLIEAEEGKTPVYGKDDLGDAVIVEWLPDWRARTSVAREFRETLKFTAEILERIYNQERIRVFQQTVLEVINEADPETARLVKSRFQSNAEIMRARLLGL